VSLSQNCPTGEALKQVAIGLLEQHRAAAILAGRRTMLAKLLAGAEYATADDVRDSVSLPHGVDPKCFGAVPKALATAKIIAKSGYVETSRAEGHARPVARWRLIDRAAALAWLAAHPVPNVPRLPSHQPSLFGDATHQLPD
jgi:hypothetical protein